MTDNRQQIFKRRQQGILCAHICYMSYFVSTTSKKHEFGFEWVCWLKLHKLVQAVLLWCLCLSLPYPKVLRAMLWRWMNIIKTKNKRLTIWADEEGGVLNRVMCLLFSWFCFSISWMSWIMVLVCFWVPWYRKTKRPLPTTSVNNLFTFSSFQSLLFFSNDFRLSTSFLERK